jgi:hypothetical protein
MVMSYSHFLLHAITADRELSGLLWHITPSKSRAKMFLSAEDIFEDTNRAEILHNVATSTSTIE